MLSVVLTLERWRSLCLAVMAAGALVFILLSTLVNAPYGRHGSAAVSRLSRFASLFISDRAAWALMEFPSLFVFAALFLADSEVALSDASDRDAFSSSSHSSSPPGSVEDSLGSSALVLRFEWSRLAARLGVHTAARWLVFMLWGAHYFNRTFVYPMRLRLDPERPPSFNVIALLAGLVFNGINAFLNGFYLFHLDAAAPSAASTLGAPDFWQSPVTWLGVAVFFAGAWINTAADAHLRSLRDASSVRRRKDATSSSGGVGEAGISSYSIPRGGAFELVSCANYFGELVEWTGFAILTRCNFAALSFVIFSAANLVPRARTHHQWYLKTFPTYPRSRRAIIPFLL